MWKSLQIPSGPSYELQKTCKDWIVCVREGTDRIFSAEETRGFLSLPVTPPEEVNNEHDVNRKWCYKALHKMSVTAVTTDYNHLNPVRFTCT